MSIQLGDLIQHLGVDSKHAYDPKKKRWGATLTLRAPKSKKFLSLYLGCVPAEMQDKEAMQLIVDAMASIGWYTDKENRKFYEERGVKAPQMPEEDR